jgi:hypothetical protein
MCWHFDQSLSCSAKQSYKREEGDGVKVGWVGVVREMVLLGKSLLLLIEHRS